jgi:DNA helicase-4
MKFTDGNLRFETYEAILIFSSVSLSCFLILPTYGIAIITTALFWWFYHQSETNRVEEVLQHISHYRERVKSEVDRVKPLSSFESYLPSRDCLELQKPINKLLIEISKLPRGYSEIWVPLKEDLEIQLKFLKKYNYNYINTEQERHNDFFNGDAYHSGNEFNEEQIIAILTNDYNNLIVAGPGAGKTRVLTSRVAFFAKRKDIPQERILVLAYNNSAAAEVRERLRNRFGLENVDINTFHSLGLRILRNSGLIASRNAVESRSARVLGEITNTLLKKDRGFRRQFHHYLNLWASRNNGLQDQRHIDEKFKQKELESYIAIDGTSVKSLAERDIANFFIKYGISYEYEKEVEWCDEDATEQRRTYCPDFYLPDFDIYIEHWSVSADGETPSFYTAEKSEYYRKNMSWKREQFEKHEKILWETNHTLFVRGELQNELSTRLSEIGVELEQVSYDELLDKAGLDKNATDVVSKAIISAVRASKVYGFSPSSLAEEIRDHDAKNRKISHDAEFILDLVIPVFGMYEEYLKEKNKIDFEDMINKAVGVLESLEDESQDSIPLEPFDLILVDEFQDISYQRLKFLENLQRINPGSRIYCVGDDWQAIYGFAGSSAQYMIDFDKHFQSPERVDLVQNYRNPTEILDFASDVIEKCKAKLHKKIIPRKIQDLEEVTPNLVFHRVPTSDEFDFRYKQNEAAIAHIRGLLSEGVSQSEIMVLSRFNFGFADLKEKCQNASDIKVEIRKEGSSVKEGIRFMSIHKSKGLEAEYVLLLNVFEGLFGFPPEFNKEMEMQIINPDLPERLDEERRLLFVASTRAKIQCTVFTMKSRESPFLQDNKFYRKHFNKQIESEFTGHIIQETEKAYQIEVHLSHSQKPVIWVPKSVTRIHTSRSKESVQSFELEEWFYAENREELNRGL